MEEFDIQEEFYKNDMNLIKEILKYTGMNNYGVPNYGWMVI